MKTTLNEVKNWMRRMIIEEGCSIPVVINGAGFSWITPSDDIDVILEGDKAMKHFSEDGIEYDEEVYFSTPMFDNYSDDVTILASGEEYDDFKSCMGEEYDDMTFILVHHNNGFNEENQDIQIGVWNYNFED